MTVLSFQILNTKVIFSVRKTKDGDGLGYLTFDKVDINYGTGKLKLRLNGIYIGKKICQLLAYIISFPKW